MTNRQVWQYGFRVFSGWCTLAVRNDLSVYEFTPDLSSHASLYVGGVRWRCVTIYRSTDLHPIFQVTHPCLWVVYVGGA
ncbi:hypothetical protein [Baaleninema simplex]|uniref:hypothetical protein n=1 Tax=Baaleninema simplex TaxID=2862350 RepID=UPI0011818288|nr:hypothetical protein [Baaleninema simplex]